MEAVSVPDWAAFTAKLQKLRDELTENFPGRAPELLFRGQSDSSWPLTTTLERAGCEGMSFDEYYRLTVQRVRPAVETITGATWDVPDTISRWRRRYSLTVNSFFPVVFPPPAFIDTWCTSDTMDFHRLFGLDIFDAHCVVLCFRTAGAAEKRSIYVYCERPSASRVAPLGSRQSARSEICSRARQALLAAIRLHDLCCLR